MRSPSVVSGSSLDAVFVQGSDVLINQVLALGQGTSQWITDTDMILESVIYWVTAPAVENGFTRYQVDMTLPQMPAVTLASVYSPAQVTAVQSTLAGQVRYEFLIPENTVFQYGNFAGHDGPCTMSLKCRFLEKAAEKPVRKPCGLVDQVLWGCQ